MNRKLLAASLLGLGIGASSAQAALLFDDWTFNFSGIDGLGATSTISLVDQIAFTGVAHSQTVISDPANPLPAVGDISRTLGLLSATGFVRNGVTTIQPPPFLNGGFEMTFTFDVAGITTLTLGPNSNFTHFAAGSAGSVAAGADGLLHIYIDNLTDPSTQGNQLTGSGYNDGVEIATFAVQGGLGGVFNALTLNGSDDARFELVSALAGVIFDKNGVDMSTKAGDLLLFSASQFDADINNDGIADVPCPSTGAIGSCLDPVGPKNFFAQEDGRASLQIPEPGTLALLGLSLFGLGFSRRRWN